jgi:hypothetical protein
VVQGPGTRPNPQYKSRLGVPEPNRLQRVLEVSMPAAGGPRMDATPLCQADPETLKPNLKFNLLFLLFFIV